MIPSPFYRGSAGGKRIEIKAKHPQMQSEIYCELKPGSLKSIPARQLIIQTKSGEIVPILISDGIKTSEDLKRELELKGIKEFKLIEYWAKENEFELIKNLLSAFGIYPTISDNNPYQDSK